MGIDRDGVDKIRIALVNNYLPFVYGGAEMVVETLAEKLREHGHQVSVTRIPFPTTLDHRLITNMLSCRCLSFEAADKVIAFKFPAFYVRHENKTVWLFHQLRQVYELWNTEYGLVSTPESAMLRRLVTQSDELFLSEARSVFAISREVASRLKTYNGINATVLYTPLDRDRFHTGEYGDFLFYAGRVTSFKRQHLAIEAMQHTRTAVRLVIAGKCDEPAYEAKLRGLIKDHGLGGRVRMLGWISEQEKADLLADALGSLYLAYQEDSPGLALYEAFYSRKCVITLDDSGGTKELVTDASSGYVVPPDPAALAEKFDALYENRRLARSLGENACEDLIARDISWSSVVEHLTR